MKGQFISAQTTAKDNFKIHSHYLHLIGGRVNPGATLEGSLHLPCPCQTCISNVQFVTC
jgi:hypothetical protein